MSLVCLLSVVFAGKLSTYFFLITCMIMAIKAATATTTIIINIQEGIGSHTFQNSSPSPFSVPSQISTSTTVNVSVELVAPAWLSLPVQLAFTLQEPATVGSNESLNDPSELEVTFLVKVEPSGIVYVNVIET